MAQGKRAPVEESQLAYFWAEFPGVPVSQDVFHRCRRVVLSPQDFESAQQTLVAFGRLAG